MILIFRYNATVPHMWNATTDNCGKLRWETRCLLLYYQFWLLTRHFLLHALLPPLHSVAAHKAGRQEYHDDDAVSSSQEHSSWLWRWMVKIDDQLSHQIDLWNALLLMPHLAQHLNYLLSPWYQQGSWEELSALLSWYPWRPALCAATKCNGGNKACRSKWRVRSQN